MDDACASQALHRLHSHLIGGQPQRAIELCHLPQGECRRLGLGRYLRQLEAQSFCPKIRTLRL
ncbi:hypothetical protein D3C86_1844960 [compost metagenome]